MTFDPLAQLEFVRRLSDSWRDLAAFLQVPQTDVGTFVLGREAWSLWQWLDSRLRLEDLPGALDTIGRQDLGDLLRRGSRIGDQRDARGDQERSMARLGGQWSKDESTSSASAALPRVWNVPARSAAFTGRERILTDLRTTLRSSARVAVLAMHGLGGVGKTSLAVEYAYRYANELELCWWINADNPSLVGEALAALGIAAGWVSATVDSGTASQAVLGRLRQTRGWLIILDNVDAPENVLDWMPHGPGRVIITSRNPGWHQLAVPIDVDVFERSESVALIRLLAPTTSVAEADRLSDAVGDLPLALAQAGGVLTATAMSVNDYLDELLLHTGMVMGQGKPALYPSSLAATVQIAARRLAEEDQAAAQLLEICARLAPEPIPVELFAGAPDGLLLSPLAAVTKSALLLRLCIGHIGRFGLARVGPGGLLVHRLTRAIIADSVDNGTRDRTLAIAEGVLVAAVPGEGRDPATWPAWSRLVPHILAMDPGASSNPHVRSVALGCAWYLLERGDLRAGHDLSTQLYEEWRVRIGVDHPHTLDAAHHLTSARFRLGLYEAAIPLARDTLLRQSQVYGPNHERTLSSASHVGILLLFSGAIVEAQSVLEETLERCRKTIDVDSHHTLGVTHNLAIARRALGRLDDALALNEEAFLQRRLVLGVDHPHTLISAEELARDLALAGRLSEALTLHEDTLQRKSAVLGIDHPHTLLSARSTAVLLQQMERIAEATAIFQDTLARRTRVLGHNHPHTLESMQDLKTILRMRGDEAQP